MNSIDSLALDLGKENQEVREEFNAAILRAKLEANLYTLAKYLGYGDIEKDTHLEMIHTLMLPTKRKLIVVPRNSFKSTIGVVCYTIWLLLKNPNEAIFIDSEVYENSKNFLREIKGHLESQKLVNLYGKFKSSTWNEGEVIVRQRTKNRKEASITCGGVGTVKVGQHYSCLVPETRVLTSNGWLMAKDIRKKHRVLTSEGKFKSVKNVLERPSNKNIIGIRSKYQHETNWITEDHKVLIFRDDSKIWVRADELLMTDKLLTPKISGKTRQISRSNPKENELILKADIWRLIGYWLAEGCRTKTEPWTIRLCFKHDETEYLEDVKSIVENHIGVECKISKRTKSNTRLAIFRSKDMKAILDRFGDCAANKHLPAFALNAPYSRQIEMIKGYWRGDGCYSGGNISFASISNDLISGFQLILARMDIQSGISKAKTEGFKHVASNKRLSYIQNSYTLSTTNINLKSILGFPTEFNMDQPIRSYFTDNYWVTPIQSIKRKEYFGAVYDFEIDTVHDFYLPGMIVHNCIIGDDYNSKNNSNTKEKCLKIIDHYKYNLNILDTTGTYVIIGTRYSENDLIGWILRDQLEEIELSEGIL